MGANLCGNSKTYDQSYSNHVRIEKELETDRQEAEKTVKILLLGSSDSGKSTIVKQMKIIHKKGFSEPEVSTYRCIVIENIIESCHFIAAGIIKLGIPIPKHEEVLITKFYINDYGLYKMTDIDQMVLLSRLKNYACVKELLARRNEVDLPDNTSYFFNDLERILNDNYQPTVDDILHARIRTCGAYEITFSFKNLNIRLIDVGGQRTERRKWIHCFDNVTAILFVVALSSYDQFMVEDKTRNRLVDSLHLFGRMFHNRYLKLASFILFLNKIDLFKEKIGHVEIKKFFAKYERHNDFQSAKEYFKECFLAFQKDEKIRIFPHFTTAIDTKNIDLMFGSACDIIIQKHIQTMGMQ